MGLYVVWRKVFKGRLGEHSSMAQRGGECYYNMRHGARGGNSRRDIIAREK